MSDLASPTEDELERAFASRTLERLRQHEKFSAEQLASLSKWLSASLLAVNGGGVIAAFNHIHELPFARSAGFSFMIGIALALLSGAALQEFYSRVSSPLSDLHEYWSRVNLTGVRDASEEEALNKPLARINQLAIVPPTLGWISGAAFIAGAVLLAV